MATGNGGNNIILQNQFKKIWLMCHSFNSVILKPELKNSINLPSFFIEINSLFCFRMLIVLYQILTEMTILFLLFLMVMEVTHGFCLIFNSQIQTLSLEKREDLYTCVIICFPTSFKNHNKLRKSFWHA